MIENKVIPEQEVAKALRKMAGPWVAVQEIPPAFSVKEVVRTTGLSSNKVVSVISERDGINFRVPNSRLTVFLEDSTGGRVNGNIDPSARLSAPMKRAVRESRYQSRRPGGGPVVKQRIIERKLVQTTLRLGRERLKIRMEPLNEDPEDKKRRETKERQALRVVNRYGIREETVSEAILEPFFFDQFSTPVQVDVAIARLRRAEESGNPLILFVPWGVRSTGDPGPEFAVMDKLALGQEKLRNMGINTEVLIMTADIYATEINKQVNPALAKKYFDFIEQAARERGFNVISWSKIRTDNWEAYQKAAKELTDDSIRKLADPDTIEGVWQSSARRSGYFSRRGIEQAAFAYMRERLIEGQIVDNVYQPIKTSVVAKNKDSLDGPLPRVYLFPQAMQFPWLK